jgi:hypothetical protein
MNELGLQEAGRAVKGMGLHVLRQRQAHRAAGRGIGHDLDGARQGGQDLLSARNAVKVAGHRAEGVAGAHIALLEALDLLEHRVGGAGGEDVTGQEQDWQAVDMRHRRGRDHVGCARANAGADRHHALAQVGFAVGHGGQCHALLVVGTVGGQCSALSPQGFAQSGHIAVAEDGEDTTAIGLDAAIRHFHPQRGHVLDQRLRHGESLCCHDKSIQRVGFIRPRQASTKVAKLAATSRIKPASSSSFLNQRKDASAHKVRPTMKPLTTGLDACAKLSAR